MSRRDDYRTLSDKFPLCVGWVKTPMAAEALKNPDIVYSALAT